MSPALLTHRDRQINRLRQEIRQVEIWLEVDANDRRATAFFKSKLAELRSDLEKLEDEQ